MNLPQLIRKMLVTELKKKREALEYVTSYDEYLMLFLEDHERAYEDIFDEDTKAELFRDIHLVSIEKQLWLEKQLPNKPCKIVDPYGTVDRGGYRFCNTYGDEDEWPVELIYRACIIDYNKGCVYVIEYLWEGLFEDVSIGDIYTGVIDTFDYEELDLRDVGIGKRAFYFYPQNKSEGAKVHLKLKTEAIDKVKAWWRAADGPQIYSEKEILEDPKLDYQSRHYLFIPMKKYGG